MWLIFCKTRVPKALADDLEAVKDDESAVKELGIKFGINMTKRLMEMGAPVLHYYTLNKDKTTFAVLDGIGRLRPTSAEN